MAHTPRTETELQSGTQRIQERWISIRKSELKPLQFHVAHGLVLLTVFAFVFAFVRGCLTATNLEEGIALRVQAAGGAVTWEQANVGTEQHIVAVRFSNQSIDTSLLKDIVQMRYLRELFLQNCRLLDGDILALRPSSSLTRIELEQNPITDKAVLHLSQLPFLEVLDLQSCPITDVSLRALGKNCPQLWQLRLDDTLVSNSGLKSLSQSSRLRILGLNGTKVDDSGMRSLRGLTQLTHLELDRTDVTDDAIATLNAILPKQPATQQPSGSVGL